MSPSEFPRSVADGVGHKIVSHVIIVAKFHKIK